MDIHGRPSDVESSVVSATIPRAWWLNLDRAYLRCTVCKSYILVRTNEESFSRFVGEPCHCGLLEPSLWQGHVTHTMVTKCKSRAKQRSWARVQLTPWLRGRCGATKLSIYLSMYILSIYLSIYLSISILLSCLGTVVRCFGGISAEEVFLTLADL